MAPIDDAADADALAAVIGALQRTGVGGGVGMYVDTDAKNSTRYLVHLTHPASDCPTILFRDEQHAEVLAAYPGTSRRCSAWCSAATRDHADTAARIVALETKLAAAHWDVVKRRDAELTYNLRTFAELQRDAVGLTGSAGLPHWAARRRSRNWLCANPITSPHSPRCGAARHGRLEALGALAFDPRPRPLADRRHRRRGLRLLWPPAHRRRADPRPLEAGGVAGGA